MKPLPNTEKLSTKFYTAKEYALVCEWWKAQGWPNIAEDMLPTGIIISYEGKEVCAGWLYKTNSKMAYMEWIVADPTADKEIKSLCLDMLIESIAYEAKDSGYTCIFTNTSHPKLIERYKNLGFTTSESGMTNMTRRI